MKKLALFILLLLLLVACVPESQYYDNPLLPLESVTRIGGSYVYKFNDGPVTCYIYVSSISCLEVAQ